MRQKIKLEHFDIEKLEFGERYFISYAGITLGEEFVFTRKKRIELCEYIVEEGKTKKVSSYWVSKRYLKQLLNMGIVHWMGKFERDEY